mgnify:CR=1 FL=1
MTNEVAAAELVEILMIYHYHLYYVSVSDVPTVMYQQVYIVLRNRAGTGMTKQVRVEYNVSKKQISITGGGGHGSTQNSTRKNLRHWR